MLILFSVIFIFYMHGIKFLVFIFREDFFTISKNAKFKTREIKSQ